jgi:hypothetical protein
VLLVEEVMKRFGDYRPDALDRRQLLLTAFQ